MTGVVRQRARIARVRRLQHGLAAAAAAEAQTKAAELEDMATRLVRAREALRPESGTGARLANLGELAMRLDAARAGLSVPLDAARRAAAGREEERLAARRRQEAAERLHATARAGAELAAERRIANSWRAVRRADLEEQR